MNEQEQELRIYSGRSVGRGVGSEDRVGQSEGRTVKEMSTLTACAHHSLEDLREWVWQETTCILGSCIVTFEFPGPLKQIFKLSINAMMDICSLG